jgi:hypothetical protein
VRDHNITDWLQSEYLSVFSVMTMVQLGMIGTMIVSVFVTGGSAYEIYANQ